MTAKHQRHDELVEYFAHHATLVRAAQAQIGEQHAGRITAESVVQQVMADLADRPPADKASLAYLRLCVRNKVRDLVRKETADKRGGGHVGRLDHADGAIDPPALGSTVSHELALREAVALLEELTDLEAAVVRGRYLDSLTYSQLAQQLNIPLGSVGLHLKNGLAKLRGRFVPPESNP